MSASESASLWVLGKVLKPFVSRATPRGASISGKARSLVFRRIELRPHVAASAHGCPPRHASCRAKIGLFCPGQGPMNRRLRSAVCWDTVHAHMWTRSHTGCRGRVVAGTPNGARYLRHRCVTSGKTKEMCARTCIFTIGQSSGVYKSMRRHGSSRWCVFDAFMRSHLAKQLCGSF